jgi:hypothetical protein
MSQADEYDITEEENLPANNYSYSNQNISKNNFSNTLNKKSVLNSMKE